MARAKDHGAWRDAHGLLTRRLAQMPELLRQATAIALPSLPFDAAAVSFVVTGVGSSEAHAKLLVHLLVELGLQARHAPPGAFVAMLPHSERDVLIVFSTGLSPNARLALAAPRTWRAVVVVSGVASTDHDAPAEKLAALSAVRDAGGLCIAAPGGVEYGTLLRIATPLVGYALAYRLAAAIGAAAGLPVDHLCIDADDLCARMAAAESAAEQVTEGGDRLSGRLAFVASGGYGELAGNLSLKIQEGLLLPAPPLWDLIGFAHGPFQEIFAQPITLLCLQRPSAPGESDLLQRLREMLDERRHRLLALQSTLPGPLALFEHEAGLNRLVLQAIAARRIDQARWPGYERDRPLYAVATPASGAAAPSAPAARSSRAHRLDALTWPQLEALIAGGCRTAVLPLGATEQHGPHLPFATDTCIADALAERFCARVGGTLRLPTLPIGCSSEHADFAGTLSLTAPTLTALLRDSVASLAQHGFTTVVIFSAHGGNVAALREALPTLAAAAAPARLLAFTDLDRLVAAWHRAGAAAGVDPAAAGHHAGEFETSIMLGLRPDSVRREQLAAGRTEIGDDAQRIFYPSLRRHAPDGVVGDPRGASAARAEAYLAAWVDVLVDWYRGAKNQKNTTGTQNA